MPSHAEQKILPHTPEQMFDMVADVARYPEFLPWCVATRVRSSDANHLVADMVIGFKVFREQFTSRVTLERPTRIKVEYEKGPFKYLENHWSFEPQQGGGCRVDFHVDFEFRSKFLEKAIGRVFTEAVHRMVAAFEKRAAALYG
ncbi:MAG: type II toxin-antitoxin system RatA family toxin [Rhodospirillaceae bacterium]|nr:type II toxin-antitoxin system RatA family toxin [Rhodospirillaceae bacterium]